MSMSRVARKPVSIPAGVDVKVVGQQLAVKGPKGQLTMPLDTSLAIDVEGNLVHIKASTVKTYTRTGSGSKLKKSIAGTTRAKLANMISGVTKGFEKKLLLVGVGYKAQAKGKVLGLTIGFSHPVEVPIPEGITVETPIPTEVLIKGIDKHLVGHTAAIIRAVRGPEPYKGKGIKYSDEVIIRKETKKK